MIDQSSVIEQASAMLERGENAAAVALVEAAARKGDGTAFHQIGLWRVFGFPLARDFAAARHAFGQAGKVGHAGSARIHAVFTALGAGGPAPDWRGAVNQLRAIADDDDAAARQIVLIDAMALTDQGAPLAPPRITPLSSNPRVGIVREALSAAECAHIMALSQPLLTPSVVVDPRTGREIEHPIRTSDSAVLGPIQQDLVVEAVNRRIAAITGTRAEQGEPLTVLRYRPGQQYRLHHDCLPGEENQRIITAIVYLNDGFSGGATDFPDAACTIRGEVGDIIVFANTIDGTRPNAASRHAGLAVSAGEKWISTRWIRRVDFDPWGMRG